MSKDVQAHGEVGRREFLNTVGGGLVLLTLTPLGCSNDDNEDQTCEGLTVGSRITDRHTHSICVSAQDLSSPPAAGRNYTSSNFEASDASGYGGAAHLHTVVLSAADLTRVAGGATVLITSAESESHTHDFSIHM